MSLSVSGVVRVSVNLSPLSASPRSFGILMIAGDSDVINGLERFRTYLNIEGVADDFGVDAPEYLAAAKYFGQTPKPSTLMIGRWIREASSGLNDGGILSPSEAALAAWTSISAGSFDIDIDGSTQSLTGLDFTGETNLNGVATVITDALSGATCEWNGSFFIITSDSTGAGAHSSGYISVDSNPTYGHQASGTLTFTGVPSPADTVTIKGTVVTFVSGTPSGNQVQIAGTAALNAAALQAFLEASADTNLAANTYNTLGAIVTVTSRAFGTAPNSYGFTKSCANITISGSGFLAGGLAADTLTVNGTACTFVNANPTGNQILVGPTAAATAANIQAFLAASENANIDDATYSLDSTTITVTAVVAGTGGDAFTLAESSSHLSVSGANLTGGATPSEVGYASATGSGTDISESLKMTSALAQALVPGYDAETPVECAAVLANMSTAWYGLMFQASTQPTDDQAIDVCDFIEALEVTRIYGVTITDTGVLSALVTTDLASRMKDGGYLQCFNQYSANAYAIASFFGRAFSVNFLAQNTTITLMFKQEPGVTGEDLTQNQALVLKNKRCNVFADYVNDTVIIQYGVMSGLAFFDEIHGLDWLQNAVQTACYNVLYTSTTKVPQTDAGVNQLVNAIGDVCGQAVNNGLVAPGVWNAQGFGNLSQGQYLKAGYYIYAQPIALQSQADRETRAAPPIQVAVKLAGAIQSVDVIIDVNR